MGQYGAYGYALAHQTYQWILGHYYGGTGTGSVAATTTIPVRLSSLDGDGNVVVKDSAVGAKAVTLTPGHTFTPASGIALVEGTWPEGPWRAFQGRIEVVTGPHTINVAPVESYVRGVVPAESPASWGVSGEAALQAQAVAARSYGLAYIRSSSAICDNTACQMYIGDPDYPSSPYHNAYTKYSDEAQSTTAGQIRVWGAHPPAGQVSGAPAFAEFSSSTGGYTAGGDFPAVVDAGDATPSNPNHSWSVSVPTSRIQSAYGASVGTVRSITVTSRNGLGDLGGRVLQMVIGGTARNLVVSGGGFAAAVGLRSDWFAITNAGGSSGGTNGYWVVAANAGVYPFGAAPNLGSMAGHALSRPVVGMAPTADGGGYWEVAGDGGIFGFGDAHFYGSTGNVHLNKPVVGMASSFDGRGYWLYAGDGGIFQFGDAHFYGSTGNVRLNKPIVGMASTPDGRGYWLVASDGGIFQFGDAHFYGSTGNVRLNRPVVGMVPTHDGHGYWLIGADGGIFQFGDAKFEGSLPGIGVSDTIVSVTPTGDGGGYLMVSAGGRVYPFGDAPYFGDPATTLPGWSSVALGIFGHKA
jgi:SpoIID/LytB domain protein